MVKIVRPDDSEQLAGCYVTITKLDKGRPLCDHDSDEEINSLAAWFGPQQAVQNCQYYGTPLLVLACDWPFISAELLITTEWGKQGQRMILDTRNTTVCLVSSEYAESLMQKGGNE